MSWLQDAPGTYEQTNTTDDSHVNTGHAHAPTTPVAPKEQGNTLGAVLWSWWVWLCCLDPDNNDDFVQVLRKTAASVNILMGFGGPVAFCFYYMKIAWFPVEAPEEQPRSLLGVKVLSIHLIFYAINASAPYVWLRWKRHLSTALMDVHIFWLTINAFLVAILLPQWSTQALSVVIVILAILSQTRFVLFHCGLNAILYLLNGYNKAYSEHEDQQLVFPGARHAPPLEHFIMEIAMEVLVVLCVAGVFAQSIAHIKHVSGSKAAVDMTRKVVKLLRRYDTDGVTKALLVEEDNGVDKDLVKSLKMMNANLETYKPFLPNYLFQNEEISSEAESEGGFTSISDAELVSDEGSFSHSSITEATNASASENASTRHSSSQASMTGYNGSNTADVYEGKITFALVEVPSCLVGRSNTKNRATAAAFAEELHAAAGISKASVHSLVGDVAMVSWNATHRLVQPELKATKFLEYLKKHQSTPFGAVAFTGVATCYNLTTSKKQHATMVAASWMPIAQAAFSLAKQFKAMLVDEATEAASAINYDFVLVDRVCLVDPPSQEEGNPLPVRHDETMLMMPQLANTVGRNSCDDKRHKSTQFSRSANVFQLIGEFAHEEAEWMYQLEMKDVSSPSTRLRDAVDGALTFVVRALTTAASRGDDLPTVGSACIQNTVRNILDAISAMKEGAELSEAMNGESSTIVTASNRAVYLPTLPLVERLVIEIGTMTQHERTDDLGAQL